MAACDDIARPAKHEHLVKPMLAWPTDTPKFKPSERNSIGAITSPWQKREKLVVGTLDHLDHRFPALIRSLRVDDRPIEPRPASLPIPVLRPRVNKGAASHSASV